MSVDHLSCLALVGCLVACNSSGSGILDAGAADLAHTPDAARDATPGDAGGLPGDAGQDGGADAAADAAGTPPVCPPNAAAGPVVALEWGEIWDTALVGADHPALALDDLVVPRPRTRALRIEPVVPGGDPWMIAGACPEVVDWPALRAEGDAEDVALVEIVALEPDGAERRGRVVWTAAADRKVEPEGEVPDGPAWLLFEPAGGPARVLIQAADGPPPWSLAVPDVPGTVALVHGAPLRSDGAAVYAPPGFAAHWRAEVGGWAETEAASWSGDIRVRPFSAGALPVPLGEDPVDLEAPRLAIVGPGGRTLNVALPCPAVAGVSVSGFADVALDQGGRTRVAGPLDADLGPIECSGRERVEVFTLTVSPLLRREVAVRIEVLR